MEFSAKQIAEFIQGEIIGDENATVHTFAKIEEGMPGAISFLSNPKYTPYIYETISRTTKKSINTIYQSDNAEYNQYPHYPFLPIIHTNNPPI